MVIHLHAAMTNAPLFKRQVKMKVPGGTTVAELLSLYEQKYDASGLFGSMLGLSVLVNDSRGSVGQELRENDRVKVFRPMTMG